jgi:hypothetical protein
MPTIKIDGYKFRFYSSDILEPPHVHVIRAEKVAKVWLQPIEVESNHGYRESELNKVVRLINEHQTRFLEAWDAHFSQ